MESSHRPNSNTRLAQERPSGQSADSGPGADAGDLSPPPFNAPKPPTMDLPPSFAAPKPPSGAGTSSSSYENVVLLPDRTPVLRGGAPADGAAANESTQPPVHKTVIQLGQGAASTPAGSSGGKQTLAPSPPTTLSSASTGSSSVPKMASDTGANIRSFPSHPVANPPPNASTSSSSPSVSILETSKLTSSTSFTGQPHCASPAAKADKRKSLPPNGTKESNRQSFTLPQDIITRL